MPPVTFPKLTLRPVLKAGERTLIKLTAYPDSPGPYQILNTRGKDTRSLLDILKFR